MTTTTTVPVSVERGLRHWLRSWSLLLRWEFSSMRMVLPMLIAVQILVGAGSVLAIGLWFDDVPPGAGLFVTTGGATIALLQVGLVMGPQLVAGHRQRGTYDFLWSLPTPRSAATAAWVVLNLIVAVPALALTFALGSFVYDLHLVVSVSVIPAVGLTVLTGTMIGYAIAHGVPNPTLVQLVTQLFVFGLFGFSPILFPDRNLPAWLVSIHRWLPVKSMADIVRASVTRGLVDDVARAYVVVGVWGAGCIVLSALILGRRP